MTTQQLIQSTINALALKSQSDNRTCRVKQHSSRKSFGPLPYNSEVELATPLHAPSGTPVVLTIEDAQGKRTSVPGVIVDLETSDCGAAYHNGRAVIIGTFVQLGGNCVALECDATAGDQAVVEKLKTMLQPGAIPNPELFSKTFNLPNHVSILTEHQCQCEPVPANSGKCDDPIPVISASNNLQKSDAAQTGISDQGPGLPPTERDECEALHDDTASKDIVFVWRSPDSTPIPKVGAWLAEKYRKEGKYVLVVGDKDDIHQAVAEWGRGISNPDSAGALGDHVTCEFGLVMDWEQTGARRRECLQRVRGLDVQIAGLISQSQAGAGCASESADQLEKLLAERAACIQTLEAAIHEGICSAPLVFANLNSALICPALMERTFDVVIFLGANQTRVSEFMVLVGLATTAVRPIGDCRQYPPVRPQPVAYEWERTVDEFVQWDVFGFCGITRSIDHGVPDPRLAILRYQRNTHPEITRAVSRLAYGGLLVGTKHTQSEEQPGSPQSGGVMVLDTSSFAPTAHEFGHPEFRFSPTSLALGVAARALHPSRSVDDQGYQHCAIITPHRNQQRLYEAVIRDQGLGIEVSTLNGPLANPAEFVILDLTDAAGVTRPDWKLSGGVGSNSYCWLTKAITSARKKLVILADMPFLMQKLPADSALRLFLREIERNSCPPIPFPESILAAPEFLETPGCSVYLSEDAAWETINRDNARAKKRVTLHWPQGVAKLLNKMPDGRLLIRGDGIEQWLVADVDVATVRDLARQGMRVTSPRRSQAGTIFIEGDVEAIFRSPVEGQRGWVEDPRRYDDPCVLIDDNLLWLVGTAREDGRGRPYLRFKGAETVRLLTGFLGLDELPGAPSQNQHSARVLDPEFA